MDGFSASSGYKEIEHTADWQLYVWAATLPGLFVEAACGMYALSGVQVTQPWEIERSLQLAANDLESLLVAFLSELVFYGEAYRLAFPAIDIQIAGSELDARLAGGKIINQAKEIKAVTYHNLAITQADHQYQVAIVFDV